MPGAQLSPRFPSPAAHCWRRVWREPRGLGPCLAPAPATAPGLQPALLLRAWAQGLGECSSLRGAGGALVPRRRPWTFWEGRGGASSPAREGSGPTFVKLTKRERGMRVGFGTVRYSPSRPPASRLHHSDLFLGSSRPHRPTNIRAKGILNSAVRWRHTGLTDSVTK